MLCTGRGSACMADGCFVIISIQCMQQSGGPRLERNRADDCDAHERVDVQHLQRHIKIKIKITLQILKRLHAA